MRSVARPLLLVALALSFAACHKSHEPEGPRVTVLFTTDEHSHLFAVAPEVDDFDLATGTIKTAAGTGALKGGIARRATILDAERAAASARGSEAVTFSSGDYSQGALSGAAHLMTAPDLVALKRLKYDAVAIGNHEFDVGPAGLAASIAAAKAAGALPPLVLTNVVFSATDTGDDALAALYGPESDASKAVAPSRIVSLPGGRKIGVVAVMGPGAATDAAGAKPVTFWSGADPMAGIIAIVQPVVNSLRAAGASAVIVLGHGGIGPKLTAAGTTGPGDDEALAMGLSGVDLVLSGHSHRQGVRVVTGADGRYVPVLQAPPYGYAVGRVDLVFDGDRPVLDPEQTAFVPVDDRTAPTADAAIVGDAGPLYGTISTLESLFLPGTLTAILGGAPTHTTRGDLYYKQIGKAGFDIQGLGGGETEALDLDTDAMLAVVNGLGLPTEVAVQNYGSIRTDLPKGATGALSFADLYRVVPNGVDPTVYPPTPGFPLVRMGLWTFALRAALEGTLLYSAVDGDYFLGGSGLKVAYDKSRHPWNQTDPFSAQSTGWITSIALVDANGVETKIYDVNEVHAWSIPNPIFPGGVTDLPTHYVVNPLAVRTVVTTYYVAAFASAFHIPLLTPAGAPTTDLAGMVVTWDGTNHVKDHQALGRYVYGLCCASPPCNAAADFASLPSIYDASTAQGHVPRRMVCSGPLCP